MNREKKRWRKCVVYSMTNAAVSNEVIAFRRGINGTLTRINAFATGGSGTGAQKVDPLSSQGSLILSRHGRVLFLFTVNAGSGSISSFQLRQSTTVVRFSVVHYYVIYFFQRYSLF
jgi:6-phosphogluconolactonase (cycloisomerase 2 family)